MTIPLKRNWIDDTVNKKKKGRAMSQDVQTLGMKNSANLNSG